MKIYKNTAAFQVKLLKRAWNKLMVEIATELGIIRFARWLAKKISK